MTDVTMYTVFFFFQNRNVLILKKCKKLKFENIFKLMTEIYPADHFYFASGSIYPLSVRWDSWSEQPKRLHIPDLFSTSSRFTNWQALVSMVRTMNHEHLCSQHRSGHLGCIRPLCTLGGLVATYYMQLCREWATTSRRSHAARAKQPFHHKQKQPSGWRKTVVKTGLLLPKHLVQRQLFPALQAFYNDFMYVQFLTGIATRKFGSWRQSILITQSSRKEQMMWLNTNEYLIRNSSLTFFKCYIHISLWKQT